MKKKIGTVQIAGVITPEEILEPVRHDTVTIDEEQEQIYIPCSEEKVAAIDVMESKKIKGIKKSRWVRKSLVDFRKWAEKNHKDYQIVFV